MQIDFHYYCIGVLAKAAGFNSNDSLTIAYASQYVDDATESEPIQVDNVIFDPVRTAHNGLKAFNWSVQKRVYMPFHFIPANPIRSTKDKYTTEAGSSFGERILDQACKEKHGLFRLCRIGIALHTYADSWAHQGFSGREDAENDVENIQVHEGDSWKKPGLSNIFLDFLPQVGHAEAGHFPDQSYRTWKCKMGKSRKVLGRNNTEDFLHAARKIYEVLCNTDKLDATPITPWEKISDDIHQLLADEEEDIIKRCNKWKENFSNFFDYPTRYSYYKLRWRDLALKSKKKSDLNWDKYRSSRLLEIKFSKKPNFYDSEWVQFHRAAMRQRHFVLENLF